MLGDYVEIGCNSVLCPGAVIGRGTTVYPTSCVRGFVPEHSVYKRASTASCPSGKRRKRTKNRGDSMGRLFGTDGVRGIANEKLNIELAMRLGGAAAAVLSGNSRRRPVFVVGMDSRMSSDMLAMACAAGLCSVGADVIMLGLVPTPAVAYLVGKYKADAGIMISASHNPAEFNGIKMFSGEGVKLPDELEERIESYALGEIAPPAPAAPEAIGKVTYMGDQVVKDYVDHLAQHRFLFPRRAEHRRGLRQRLRQPHRAPPVRRPGRADAHALPTSPTVSTSTRAAAPRIWTSSRPTCASTAWTRAWLSTATPTAA